MDVSYHFQLHLHCKQSLEDQCVELHALLEEREGEWQQRESRLQQTIRDKEELVERYKNLLIFPRRGLYSYFKKPQIPPNKETIYYTVLA